VTAFAQVEASGDIGDCHQGGRRRRERSTCNDIVEIANEDYEDGVAEGWSGGLVAFDHAATHFLGRLGMENSEISKKFTVPKDATRVDIKFSLYELGDWEAFDEVFLRVGSTEIGLGDLTEATSSDIVGSIAWMRSLSASRGDVEAHDVFVSVPNAYFLFGKLQLDIRTATSKPLSVLSAGIDNLIVTAHGVCDGDEFQLTTESEDEVIDELSLEDDEGTAINPYCSSSDFPCGDDDDTVYVCHYSSLKGYQTFCIPEVDSDVVQFYQTDYCGPCVGGYGAAAFEHEA